MAVLTINLIDPQTPEILQGVSFPTFTKGAKHRLVSMTTMTIDCRDVLAQTMALQSINLIDPQTQNYNRVLVFQRLVVLLFQLLQKVPNTGLVAMTTKMHCRDVP